MVRPRQFDEERALEAALHVFWNNGYEVASLTELTSSMGIQKPSLYSAFGDKKTLFETALRKYTQSHAYSARAKLQGKTLAKAAISSYFEQVIDEAYGEKTDYRGCFSINTMVELAPHDEKFAVLTREHQMYLAAIFQETIERGMQSGELSNNLDAKALAQTLVVTLIGITVLMKSRPDRQIVQNSVDSVLGLIW